MKRCYPGNIETVSASARLLERYHASIVITTGQRIVLCGIALALAVLILWDYVYALLAINLVICLFYCVITVFKLALLAASYAMPPPAQPDGADSDRAGTAMPIYTVLVPMYREANMVEPFLAHLERMDYPRDRLDVKLLLEPDDDETIAAARAITPAFPHAIILSPESGPRTKPRACNAGLEQARGEFLVIYDAEDRPEPDQLRKAVKAFDATEPRTACLQCHLDYYNPCQNWLTRSFTVEYACWFRLFLPGLHRLGLPIPLGGTSNHFRTSILKDLGGWDAYNLTEDCELGMRLHAAGWRTAILDSTTWEEANSRVGNWLRQRSRWCKGYLQTLLAYTRCPLATARLLGARGFLGFLATVGGFTAMILLNPVYWIIACLHVAFRWRLWYPGNPVSLVFATISVALAAGNIVFVAANLLAVRRRGGAGLVMAALLSPFYWILISIGAWKGLLQLCTKPFYWEKTRHGLCPT